MIKRQTKYSAGADMTCSKRTTIEPNQTALVPTDYYIDNHEYSMFYMLCARSSIALKKNLILMNGVGIIDSDYKDEVKVMYRNVGTEPVTLEKGERIAQIIPLSYLPLFEALDNEREGGFGSSGTT